MILWWRYNQKIITINNDEISKCQKMSFSKLCNYYFIFSFLTPDDLKEKKNFLLPRQRNFFEECVSSSFKK